MLVKRMKGRALREIRFDDINEQVIRHRLEEYEAQTAPTLSYYPPDRIQEIDATNTPVAVLSERHSVDIISIPFRNKPATT